MGLIAFVSQARRTVRVAGRLLGYWKFDNFMFPPTSRCRGILTFQAEKAAKMLPLKLRGCAALDQIARLRGHPVSFLTLPFDVAADWVGYFNRGFFAGEEGLDRIA